MVRFSLSDIALLVSLDRKSRRVLGPDYSPTATAVRLVAVLQGWRIGYGR